MDFLNNLYLSTTELAPWLLLGMAIAGVLHILLPKSIVRNTMRGPLGPLWASLLGVPLPLCSCGVIPVGLGFYKSGASKGASTAFLISTPQTGVDSILVAAGMLGWPFAIAKTIAALVTGWLGGFLVDAISNDTQANEDTQAIIERPSLKDGIAHSLDILRTISGWLVFGVLVSAVIQTFVGPQYFAEIAQKSGYLLTLGVLILSIPLYVCATASVPIAASLVAAGFPPSAALVFLMAGPATNISTIGAIAQGLGRRVAAIYLSVLVVGAFAFGYLLDTWSVMEVISEQVIHHHKPSVLATGSAILLLLLICYFFTDSAITYLRRRAKSGVTARVVVVDGITCGGCVRKIEGAFAGDSEVDELTAHKETGEIYYRGVIQREKLLSKLQDLGYSER